MEWITANLGTLIAAGLGGVLFLAVDRILLFLIGIYYPAQFLDDIANQINNRLEALKKKYPSAGKELEDKVLTSLANAVKIIES